MENNQIYKKEFIDRVPIIQRLSTDAHLKSFMELMQDNAIIAELKNAPTVDAVEVVHGQWKRTPVSGRLYCGVCDRLPEHQLETNYCPNCGAKMDGGND